MDQAIRSSDQINEVATSLAKAQAKFAAIIKNRENPHFKSKYADLDAVISATRPALAAEGIALVQGVSHLENGAVCVETRIIHASGQWISIGVTMIPRDQAPQGIGSALTYGRRYSLAALLGVASEDDDDGEQAEGRRDHKSNTTTGGRFSQPVDTAQESNAYRSAFNALTEATTTQRLGEIQAKIAEAQRGGRLSESEVAKLIDICKATHERIRKTVPQVQP